MILRWLGFGRKVASAKAKLMYKPTTVRLFIKPFCGWCDEVMAVSRDVTSDRAAWDEMVRLSGQSSAPVIEVDGEMLADFGASELAQFWNEIS